MASPRQAPNPKAMNKMDREQIEEVAAGVRKEIGEGKPPVNVLRIAGEESILLAPGDYGENFDGRIEYHRKKGKFILFYPGQNSTRTEGRVRFSVAHELGHYYLPRHRELLLGGKFHCSQVGFICDNRLEREADLFAASLLVPEAVLSDLCERRKFLNLKDILQLANAWNVSATCAAIRYVEYASEACALLVSRNGEVLYYIPSEDAAYRGFEWLGAKTIPRHSATAEAAATNGPGHIIERETHTETWFSQRRAGCSLWEEAYALGYTGLVLTMLAFDVEGQDDDE